MVVVMVWGEIQRAGISFFFFVFHQDELGGREQHHWRILFSAQKSSEMISTARVATFFRSLVTVLPSFSVTSSTWSEGVKKLQLRGPESEREKETHLLKDQGGTLAVNRREGAVIDPKLREEDLILVGGESLLQPLLRLGVGLARVNNGPKGGVVEIIDVTWEVIES